MNKQILIYSDEGNGGYASRAVRYAASLDGIITLLSGMSNLEQMDEQRNIWYDGKCKISQMNELKQEGQIMNETLQSIEKRSSTRAYTEEKLTEEEIQAILTAGLQAPTARNEQEIHFSVLDGTHPVLAEIETEKRAFLAAMADENAKDSILNAPHNFYYEAPTVFILSADRDFPWSKLDAGIAVENMALAAEALGLGSVIIGIISGAMEGEKKAYFAKACSFPENYEFAIALAVGHKAAEKEPHAIDFEKSVTIIK